ncbi:MAG: flagellar hook protein FlgE [Nitrospirota bacterium]
MGLSSGFYNSLSGLNASGAGLSVIGNNIANINTVGFKSSRSLFGDILNSTVNGDASMQVGRGVGLDGVQTLFGQGTVLGTGNALDFAIQGEGFFTVSDASRNNALFYTRDGQFVLDEDHYIVNANGLRLQGTAGDIQIPVNALGETVMPPLATGAVSMQVNLSANSALPTMDWDNPLNPPNNRFSSATGPVPGSYNFTSSVTVYDSAGNSHLMDVFFRKTTTNLQWEAFAVWDANGQNTNGLITHDYRYQALGALTFGTTLDAQGRTLVNLASPAGPVSAALQWDPVWQAGPQTVTIDFSGSTQYGLPSAANFLTADGYPEGGLTNFRIDREGQLFGLYSNGQEMRLDQLRIARFAAPTELSKAGKNLFARSETSGAPVETVAGSGGAGLIFGNSLEMSNINLADEFVTMIAMQRAFQANAQAMTTTNEMLIKLTQI